MKDIWLPYLDSRIKKLITIAVLAWIVCLVITVQPWKIGT